MLNSIYCYTRSRLLVAHFCALAQSMAILALAGKCDITISVKKVSEPMVQLAVWVEKLHVNMSPYSVRVASHVVCKAGRCQGYEPEGFTWNASHSGLWARGFYMKRLSIRTMRFYMKRVRLLYQIKHRSHSDHFMCEVHEYSSVWL